MFNFAVLKKLNILNLNKKFIQQIILIYNKKTEIIYQLKV
jgi:hypothetical protein